MACGRAHHGRDPWHRLRGRAAPLARPLGAGVGAAARPAPPHHRRGHDGHDDGRDGRASGPGRGRGDADRRGGRGPHHAGGIRRLERRAAARGVDVARAAAAADLRLKRAAIIVLDGVGIGPAPDTAAYGDAGSDTLGNVARAVGGLRLPNLERLGLGWCRPIAGLAPGVSRSDPGREPGAGPAAAYGIAFPQSQGKDSTTGHWEICGVLLERPFRTYPNGFPTSLLDEFARRTGRGWLGNKAASGTAIIAELGEAHQRTGKWIVYTSADSVFQVAAHEETVPLAELYRACGIARDMLVGEHAVSRVIARPFTGTPGAYRRTAQRKDFSLEPVGTTLLDRLAAAGVPRVGIGKVDDLFAGRNIASEHTPTNGDAYRLIERALADTGTGFIFVNVIEFDQTWGHRNDVPGFHEGLKELDAWIPRLEARVRGDDLIIITADHGNDPTTPSTDHSREAVPILALGPRVRPRALGERRSFADMGATVAEYFGVAPLAAGTSFLGEIRA
ncbi:MAG: phosphopentomutase [Gemmatimonadetes bacterium]|nr:MAG: phosphopentomutase [Gemmatimonadota bacterium]